MFFVATTQGCAEYLSQSSPGGFIRWLRQPLRSRRGKTQDPRESEKIVPEPAPVGGQKKQWGCFESLQLSRHCVHCQAQFARRGFVCFCKIAKFFDESNKDVMTVSIIIYPYTEGEGTYEGWRTMPQLGGSLGRPRSLCMAAAPDPWVPQGTLFHCPPLPTHSRAHNAVLSFLNFTHGIAIYEQNIPHRDPDRIYFSGYWRNFKFTNEWEVGILSASQ